MNTLRRLRNYLLLVLIAAGAIYGFNWLTDGFSLHQITSSLPPCTQFEVPLTEEQRDQLALCFDQPFHYLGKGCQFYVFGSRDGKYIIKFFKHKHLRPFTWLNNLPLPSAWKAACNQKIIRRQQRVNTLFTSCKLAYDKLPAECGLLYIHLHRIPVFHKEVTLIDPLGCRRKIQLDDYEYILQKKAIPLKEYLLSSNAQEVSKKKEQLSRLVIARCQQGIRDDDPAFFQNVGFLTQEETPIYLDIGRFYEDPSILLEEEQIKDVTHRQAELEQWLLASK